MTQRRRPRVGAVSFLNTVPLIEGLSADPRVELQRDLPARLADLLHDQRLEVGLIPVVEYLRGVGDALVPGIAIASRGPVRTVKVFSRQPIEEVESIGVDRGSRSSVALLRVLLAERFGCDPDLHVFEPRPESLFTHHPAALVIGDRADEVNPRGLFVYDLGELWTQSTGLPFVYAVWALGAHVDRPQRQRICTILQDARDRGLVRLEQLAHEEAQRRGIDPGGILGYWRENIDFRLGDEELQGLRHFAELAARYDLVPAARAVQVAG